MSDIAQSQQEYLAPRRPTSVTLAARLMGVGALLSLTALVLTFATAGTLKSQVQAQLSRSGLQISPATVDAATTIGIVTGVVAGAVGIGLWLWMAWKNAQGRSWARVLGTIFGAINILSVIVAGLTNRYTTANLVVAIVSGLLTILIIVLMYRKDASAFYAIRSNRGLQAAVGN